MRSLYLKVFLAFWLVMTLVVGSNMLLTWLLARQFEDSQTRNHYLTGYAEQALDQYLEQGPEGLKRWQRQLERQTGLRVLLLDERSRSLSGGPLPPFLRSLIHRIGQGPPATSHHPAADLRAGRPHRSMMMRHQRPLIWPIQQLDRQYLLVVLNPHKLLDHLYSGSSLLWRVGLSILLVGLLSVLMARYLIRPIRQLQHASQQLAAGQLDTRVSDRIGNRRDELGQLGQDFDRMAERIQTLLKGQQQLLRDVSHELRTPLARQRIALELARKQPGSAAALDRIEQQAEQLDELIGEILMLARLDAQASPDPDQQTDLSALLQLLTAEFNVDQPRVTFSTSAAVRVNLDSKLMHRAVANLVNNALKYSTAAVQLELDQIDQQARIRVRDRGPGVEPAMLQQIFEPFVRTDQARSRQQGGWGLGLAIAARVVQQHQGTITASNLEPHGLEIEMRLPLTVSSHSSR